MNEISNRVSKFLIYFIRVYQNTFSPDHSARGKARHPFGFCRFSPSCSEYAKQTLEHRGILGIGKIIIRIMRCNPFSAPAYDPVERES